MLFYITKRVSGDWAVKPEQQCMIFHKMNELFQRIFISVVAILILVVTIGFAGHPGFEPIFTLLTALVIILSLREYCHIALKQGLVPLERSAIFLSVLYVFFTYLGIRHPHFSLLPFVAVWISLLVFFAYYFNRGKRPLINLAVTFFGIFYITLPLSLIINITYFFPRGSGEDGRYWLIYLLLIAKVTDMGAYFVGRYCGTRKIAPYISPKKTIEGAIGGLLLSIGAGIFYIYLLHSFFIHPPFSLGYYESILISSAISCLSQFSDLAESLLKRDGGIKNSSTIPGLGGFLDIVDSLLFTCPFVYFLLKFFYT